MKYIACFYNEAVTIINFDKKQIEDKFYFSETLYEHFTWNKSINKIIFTTNKEKFKLGLKSNDDKVYYRTQFAFDTLEESLRSAIKKIFFIFKKV